MSELSSVISKLALFIFVSLIALLCAVSLDVLDVGTTELVCLIGIYIVSLTLLFVSQRYQIKGPAFAAVFLAAAYWFAGLVYTSYWFVAVIRTDYGDPSGFVGLIGTELGVLGFFIKQAINLDDVF